MQGGATAALDDTSHKATVALHILNTVVPNVYKNNPQRLAEWGIASHIERHTAVPRPPATPPVAPSQPVTPVIPANPSNAVE